MSVKSTTQMTKAELLDVINDKNRVIAELNDKIDELSAMSDPWTINPKLWSSSAMPIIPAPPIPIK